MKRSDFRFLDRLRVRWAEVDMQKIVFNGHYLMYFDTAVAGYWRALALPYHETMEQLQGDLYVRKATLEYEGSARYDDQLEVGIRCARLGKSSLVFGAAAFRGEQRLVDGDLVYVFADPATQTSRPVPEPLRDVLNAYERGEPMLDVRTGTWDAVGREAQVLRHAVFVQEQRIPAELEWDAADAGAVHAVACNRFGLSLGTGRLVELNVREGSLVYSNAIDEGDGDSIETELRVAADAKAGSHPITVGLRWDDSWGGTYSDEVTIGVEVGGSGAARPILAVTGTRLPAPPDPRIIRVCCAAPAPALTRSSSRLKVSPGWISAFSSPLRR